MNGSKNQAQIEGTLVKGKYFQVRYTPQGTAVCDFQIKTVDLLANGRDDTQFHNLFIFGDKAEEVKNTAEGAKARAIGRLTTQNWVDKTTNKKMYKTKIEVQELWLESKADRAVASAHEFQQGRAAGFQPDGNPIT